MSFKKNAVCSCEFPDIMTVGADSGDPSGKHIQKMICRKCGSPVKLKLDFPLGDASDKTLKLRIHIFGRGERCSLTSTIDLPFKEGKYDLTHYDYPLCRYGAVQIFEGSVIFDGEEIAIPTLPTTLQRIFPVASTFEGTATETHMITLSCELT